MNGHEHARTEGERLSESHGHEHEEHGPGHHHQEHRHQERSGNEHHEHHEHHAHHEDHEYHERGREEVCITINRVEKLLPRGRHTVTEIKNLGGVPLADDLDEVVDGKLTSVADDGSVEICGGEVFLSHPKDGGSSH